MKTLTTTALALAACLIAGGASAQQITGTTTPASPSGVFPRFTNAAANCVAPATAVQRYYVTRQVTISTTGVYIFSEPGLGIDGNLGLYFAPFDPSDPTLNCVVSVDDNRTINITAGTYHLVLSNFFPATTGSIVYDYTGPGTITDAVVIPASVPTMSEWAMILFGTILAGAAALYIQRRSLVA